MTSVHVGELEQVNAYLATGNCCVTETAFHCKATAHTGQPIASQPYDRKYHLCMEEYTYKNLLFSGNEIEEGNRFKGLGQVGLVVRGTIYILDMSTYEDMIFASGMFTMSIAKVNLDIEQNRWSYLSHLSYRLTRRLYFRHHIDLEPILCTQVYECSRSYHDSPLETPASYMHAH